MRNRPIFRQIKQFVADRGYTVEQVSKATPEQFAQVANLTEQQAEQVTRFWPGIKRLCLLDLQHQVDTADMDALKSQAKAWLDANFPHWQAERGREDDKPFVTIWLQGKPAEVDNG